MSVRDTRELSQSVLVVPQFKSIFFCIVTFCFLNFSIFGNDKEQISERNIKSLTQELSDALVALERWKDALPSFNQAIEKHEKASSRYACACHRLAALLSFKMALLKRLKQNDAYSKIEERYSALACPTKEPRLIEAEKVFKDNFLKIDRLTKANKDLEALSLVDSVITEHKDGKQKKRDDLDDMLMKRAEIYRQSGEKQAAQKDLARAQALRVPKKDNLKVEEAQSHILGQAYLDIVKKTQ